MLNTLQPIIDEIKDKKTQLSTIKDEIQESTFHNQEVREKVHSFCSGQYNPQQQQTNNIEFNILNQRLGNFQQLQTELIQLSAQGDNHNGNSFYKDGARTFLSGLYKELSDASSPVILVHPSELHNYQM